MKPSLEAWAHVDIAAGLIEPVAVLAPIWRSFLDAAQRLLQAALASASDTQRLTYNSLLHLKERFSAKYHTERAHDPARPANATFHNYNDEQARLAYFLFFVPRHARALAQGLGAAGPPLEAQVARAWAEHRPYTVAAVGGGPGADLFGLLLYVQESPALCQHPNREHGLHITTLDLPEWGPVWGPLQAAVTSHCPAVQVQFSAADCTRPEAASLVPADADLLVFCNFLAELQVLQSEFSDAFGAVLARVRPGGLILSLEPRQDAARALKAKLLLRYKARLRAVGPVRTLQRADPRPVATFRQAGSGLLRALRVPRARVPAGGGGPAKGKQRQAVLVVAERSSQQPAEVQLWRRAAGPAGDPPGKGPGAEAGPGRALGGGGARAKKRSKKRRRGVAEGEADGHAGGGAPAKKRRKKGGAAVAAP